MANEELEQVEKEIEISIEAARDVVRRKDAMDRLIQNDDFKDIFIEGYMEKEPARLTSLLLDSDWQTEERQAELMNDLRAISGFRQYVLTIKQLGKQMENQIARSETELERIREEGE